ncbi:hypothetical protein JCM1840_002750 [Sporobolomyces johnsonii]
MASRHLTRVVLDELDDWLCFLRSPIPIKASFALPPCLSDHHFFTDACNDGLAKPSQIAAAEAWAVKIVGAIVKAMGIENEAVLVGVDNTNVIDSFAKGRASNKFVNNAIRRLFEAMQLRNIVLFLRYVNTKCNLADAVSRGFLDPHLSLFPLSIPPPPGTEAGPRP